jgi:hypothetical protein
MNILQILYLEEKPANSANAVVLFVLYDGYWQFVGGCYFHNIMRGKDFASDIPEAK